MKKRIISVLITLAFLGLSYNATAQVHDSKKTIKANKENLQKLVDNPKKMKKLTRTSSNMPAMKFEKKYNIKNGYCTIDDYKVPKRVLITSFIIEDDEYITIETFKLKTRYSTDYTTTTTTTKASDEKVNAIAQRMFEQSIGKMKTSFAALGMELLTPKEYCNTEELKNAYYNKELPILTKNIVAAKSNSAAVPDDFRFYPQGYTRFTGGKVQKEWDSYLRDLKLDGFIDITIHMSAAEEVINKITVSFTYKNPGNQDIYVVGYNPFPVGERKVTFDSPLHGIFEKEEVEYVNKRGKTKTKFVSTDIDSNISEIINITVAGIAKKVKTYILKPLKK